MNLKWNKKFELSFRADLDSDEGPGDSACVVSSVLSDTTATTTDQVRITYSLLNTFYCIFILLILQYLY